jgi:succinate dehydrogenase/fumarate reductase-like Fe-S protein
VKSDGSPPTSVTVRVLRGDPGEPLDSYWQQYEVPFAPGRSVTGTLWLINELHDGGLAYRVSCHRGICASCIMRINGKQLLACVIEVTGDLTLEPGIGTVIKDLVIEQV